MKSWNSALNGVFFALARSTQALPSTLRRLAMPRSWRSFSSIEVALSLQEVDDRLGVELRLLDVRDMGGIESGELGAPDLLHDHFADGGWRRRVLLADDDQSRRGDARIGA